MADHWRTPKSLLTAVSALSLACTGKKQVALDPFPPPAGYRNFVDARVYQRDSLKADWKSISEGGLVYCNPPYSRPRLRRAMDKMFEEHRRGTWILALVAASTDVGWFQEAAFEHASQILFLKGRVPFVGPVGKKDPAKFPSAILHFPRTSSHEKEFQRVFGPMGILVPCSILRSPTARAEVVTHRSRLQGGARRPSVAADCRTGLSLGAVT